MFHSLSLPKSESHNVFVTNRFAVGANPFVSSFELNELCASSDFDYLYPDPENSVDPLTFNAHPYVFRWNHSRVIVPIHRVKDRYVFDIVFVLFQSYRARLRESFDYARRFLAKNADTIYETIRETRDDLYDYICGAINNRMALLGDIKDFSRLKDAYIDLRSVLLFDNLKKKRTYLLSKGLLLMMTTIAVIAFAFSFIVYLLGAIFGVAL